MTKKKLAVIMVPCIIAIVVAIFMVNRTNTLTTDVNPPGTGSVSPSWGAYTSNVRVTLTASPASGYYFSHWSGSASGTTSTITITMDSNKRLTANFESTPQPQFTTPGTGAIIGQVMRPDSEPAFVTVVYIFKGGETSSYASCFVDMNGYYMFDDLPPERYSLFTATGNPSAFGPFVKQPDALVTVLEGVTTTAPTLIQSLCIGILLPDRDPVTGKITDCNNPKFTWTDVPKAAYYVVTIKERSFRVEYKETQEVVTNTIVWPTNLSSLPYQDFEIDVEAYAKGDILIASGDEWFHC